MHMWKNALEHVWNTRPIKPTQKLIDRMPKVMKAIIEAKGGKTKYWIQNVILKSPWTMVMFVDFKSSRLLVFWQKVYHRKTTFFERQKKLKIGRGWPMSAGTVADGFWTSLQKHLTPFHKKISVRSSILKKILASDSGAVICGQHGSYFCK